MVKGSRTVMLGEDYTPLI